MQQIPKRETVRIAPTIVVLQILMCFFRFQFQTKNSRQKKKIVVKMNDEMKRETIRSVRERSFSSITLNSKFLFEYSKVEGNRMSNTMCSSMAHRTH